MGSTYTGCKKHTDGRVNSSEIVRSVPGIDTLVAREVCILTDMLICIVELEPQEAQTSCLRSFSIDSSSKHGESLSCAI